MKKLVSYLLCYALYHLGTLACKIMLIFDRFWMYKVYNWLMNNSLRLQEWGDIHPEYEGFFKGPWREPTDD